MSKLNISENLFLDVNEIKHLVKFIVDDGYKSLFKQIVHNYGIVHNNENNNFVVTKVDDNNINVSSGIAFDGNLNAIVLNSNQSIELVNNIEHYICIKYAETHIEDGVVSVSQNGVISGLGTEFTEVLRGQPNFPTKIKFPNSVVNTGEYEVVSVLSDTSAILSGDFVAEGSLKYSVIGTFTPGAVIADTNKEIYTYDSCEVFVVDGDTLTIPTLNENEYFIAKINYSEGILYVTDIRDMNVFSIENIQNLSNAPFINLFNVHPKALNKIAFPNGNLVSSTIGLWMEFCYQIDSFSIADNNLTIISGTNSKYDTVSDIPDGIFNGCLLYNRTNNTKSIIQNFVSGVCTLNSEITISQGDELYIIPNADEIEFEVNSVNLSGLNFPIHVRVKVDDFRVEIPVESNFAYNNPVLVIKYRLISNNVNTLYQSIESCSYFDEIDGNTKVYTSDGILVKAQNITL